MNGPVSSHRLARFELNAAARYYEAQRPGLGLRFLDAAEYCVRSILEFPDSGKTVRGEIKRRLVGGQFC